MLKANKQECVHMHVCAGKGGGGGGAGGGGGGGGGGEEGGGMWNPA